MPKVGWIAIVIMQLAMAGCAGVMPRHQNVGVTNVTTLTQIPRGFNTYTLFLSTSFDYSELAGVDTITQQLAKAFRDFGNAIGPENLAVFVSDPNTGKLEVSAGQFLLQQLDAGYGLQHSPQDGPYIIVLKRHPADKPDLGDTAAVISLRGHTPAEIQKILDSLIGEIQAATTRLPPRPSKSQFESFWVAVRDGWNAGNGVGAETRALATMVVSHSNGPQ